MLDQVVKDYLDQHIPHDDGICVAVSGGPDSMLLASILSKLHPHTYFVTVNHHLRPEAKAEANFVNKYFQHRHTVLDIQINNKQAALQEQARKQRYIALESFCKQHSIKHIFLAHHGDDQIETFMMRLKKASGPHGLGGMQSCIKYQSVILHRPLLGVLKVDILAAINSQKIDFVQDPSNENSSFQRVRERGLLQNIDSIEKKNILSSIQKIQKLNSHIQKTIDQIMQNIRIHDCHYDFTAILKHDAYFIESLIKKIIIHHTPHYYPPSDVSLQGAITQLVIHKKTAVSIHGLILRVKRKITLIVEKDPRVIAKSSNIL